MDAEPSLGGFDKAVRFLGPAFYRWVLEKMAGRGWNTAALEARYAKDNSYWHDKMRVFATNGEVVSLTTNPRIRSCLSDMSELRKILGWYSFTLVVTHEGAASLEYHCDPNSAEYLAFFDN